MTTEFAQPETAPPRANVVSFVNYIRPTSAAAVSLEPWEAEPVDQHQRDYVDKSVEVSRAQSEARFSEVMSALATMRAENDAGLSKLGSRLDLLDGDLKGVKLISERAEQAAHNAETAARGIKWNVAFVGLSVAALTVTMVFGLAAIWGQAVEMTTGILSSPKAEVMESEVPQPSPEAPKTP